MLYGGCRMCGIAGIVNLSGNAPTGGSGGGFMTWLGELAKGGI